MSVRIHPRVTALQLRELTDRHRLSVRYDWIGKKPRVYVEALPAPAAVKPGWEFACERCEWVGVAPPFELFSTFDPVAGERIQEVPRCPACRSFALISRRSHA